MARKRKKKPKQPNPRRNRIDKSDERKLADLEDHLYLLRDQLRDLKHDPAHIKIISGQLRTLLCSVSGTEGLLWRLIDHFSVDDHLNLHMAGRLNPDHPLAKGLKLSVVPIARPNSEIEKKLPVRDYSFRDIIKNSGAVYTIGKSYTHEELIRLISEQTGVAHEDDGVSPGLALMEELLINGRAAYFPVLQILAEITLQIGERVLATASALNGFRRRRYSPPLSLSIHCTFMSSSVSKILVSTFKSFIAELTIKVFLLPQSFLFKVCKEGKKPFVVTVALPEKLKKGEDYVFSLGYIHDQQSLKCFGPNIAGREIQDCDLGYIGAADILQPIPNPARYPYLKLKACYVHERIFSPKEVAELPEILIEQSPILQ